MPDDSGLTKSLTDLAKLALMDVLPKSPTAFGGKQNNAKSDAIGQKGTETIGYVLSNSTPDPTRIPKKRKPHKRDNSHQSMVTLDANGVPIKTQSDKNDKRKDYENLIFRTLEAGQDRPYVLLYNDRVPAELHFNVDNAEHPIMAHLKTYGERVLMLQTQMGEIRAKTPEAERMVQSDERVNASKSMGRYPKVVLTASSRSRHRGDVRE